MNIPSLKLFYIDQVYNDKYWHHEFANNSSVEYFRELLGYLNADGVLMFAKNWMGYCMYPSRVVRFRRNLNKDVFGMVREAAAKQSIPFYSAFIIGRDVSMILKSRSWGRTDINGKGGSFYAPTFIGDRAENSLINDKNRDEFFEVAPNLRDIRYSDEELTYLSKDTEQTNKWYKNSLCFLSGAVETYIHPYIKEVLEKYDPDVAYLDGTTRIIVPCFCEICKKRFKDTFHLDPPRSPFDASYTAYKQMHRELYKNHIKNTIDIIKQMKPKIYVMSAMGWGISQPDRPLEDFSFILRDTEWINQPIGELTYDIEVKFAQSQKLPFSTVLRLVDGDDIPLKRLQLAICRLLFHGGHLWPWVDWWYDGRFKAEHMEKLKQLFSFMDQLAAYQKGYVLRTDLSVLLSKESQYKQTMMQKKSYARCYTWSNIALYNLFLYLKERKTQFNIIPDWHLEDSRVFKTTILVPDPIQQEEWVRRELFARAVNGCRIVLLYDDNNSKDLIQNLYPEHERIIMLPIPTINRELKVVTDKSKRALDEALLDKPEIIVGAIPSSIEVICRENETYLLVHLINTSIEESLSISGGKEKPIQDSDARCPDFDIEIGLNKKPTSVEIEPGKSTDAHYSYANNVLEIRIPGFELYKTIRITK